MLHPSHMRVKTSCLRYSPNTFIYLQITSATRIYLAWVEFLSCSCQFVMGNPTIFSLTIVFGDIHEHRPISFLRNFEMNIQTMNGLACDYMYSHSPHRDIWF